MRWQCEVCGFIYDEAHGLPEDGIPPDTPLESLPEDWECPECGAAVEVFIPLEE
ncbi:rubredoxin [Pseudaeromonas sp. ZJS20]|uniref:rubredoxin n=1 Tax=Pseudaeromonas aegiceratis TaxID=3153928 RepID=UPI00390C7D04